MIKRSRGFTIIELLVVISVIGILSTITLIGFNRYQADSRDTQRSSRATALAEALEKYYDKHGEYPSCSTMQSQGSATAALPGVDPSVLVTPLAVAGDQDSIDLCTTLTTGVTTDSFAYVGDGSTACISGGACLQFSLQYKQESTGTIASITSRRKATLSSSGTVSDLSATTYSFSRIDLTWTATSGALSYNVQYSTNQTTWTAATSTSTNSTSVTGLTLGTLYYFQVQPVSGATTGGWSNTASATTYSLDTPVGTASDDATTPTTVLDFQWNTVANATSYTMQYAPNNCTSGGFTTVTGIPPGTYPGSITRTVTGLTAGTQLCFQVKAVAAGYTSGWSAGSTAVTTVPAPTGVTATVNSNTQITVSWSSGVANTYTVQYSTNSAFGSYSSISGIAGTSQAVTGLQEGTKWYFRVIAYVSTTPSVPSSVVNGTTGEDGASNLSVSAVRTGTTSRYDTGNWIVTPAPTNWYYAYTNVSATCPSGSYAVYNVANSYDGTGADSGSTGATTGTYWQSKQPLSGYWIKFSMQAYCQGPNTNSGWSGWVSLCAKNSSPNNAGCPF